MGSHNLVIIPPLITSTLVIQQSMRYYTPFNHCADPKSKSGLWGRFDEVQKQNSGVTIRFPENMKDTPFPFRRPNQVLNPFWKFYLKSKTLVLLLFMVSYRTILRVFHLPQHTNLLHKLGDFSVTSGTSLKNRME